MSSQLLCNDSKLGEQGIVSNDEMAISPASLDDERNWEEIEKEWKRNHTAAEEEKNGNQVARKKVVWCNKDVKECDGCVRGLRLPGCRIPTAGEAHVCSGTGVASLASDNRDLRP